MCNPASTALVVPALPMSRISHVVCTYLQSASYMCVEERSFSCIKFSIPGPAEGNLKSRLGWASGHVPGGLGLWSKGTRARMLS